VTASLVEKAPPELTRTINRVVERTIERVVPSATSSATTVKETTVVIKDEDATAKAIEKAQNSVVPIFSKSTEETPAVFLGWGVVIAPQGLIVTDQGIVISGATYTVNDAEQSFDATVGLTDDTNHLALLKVLVPEKTKAHSFIAASLSDSDSLKLGQSVIVFGGNQKRSVSVGIVSSLDQVAATASSTSKGPRVTSIESSVAPYGGVVGAPILNVFGDLLGIGVKAGETGRVTFTPVNAVKQLMTDSLTPPAKPQQ
jgi:hypothetical protein